MYSKQPLRFSSFDASLGYVLYLNLVRGDKIKMRQDNIVSIIDSGVSILNDLRRPSKLNLCTNCSYQKVYCRACITKFNGNTTERRNLLMQRQKKHFGSRSPGTHYRTKFVLFLTTFIIVFHILHCNCVFYLSVVFIARQLAY